MTDTQKQNFNINMSNWEDNLVSCIKIFKIKFSLDFVINNIKNKLNFIISYQTNENSKGDRFFREIWVNSRHYTDHCEEIESVLCDATSEILYKIKSQDRELLIKELLIRVEEILEKHNIKLWP